MLSLQGELTSTENQVSLLATDVHDAVMQYNTPRETFPHHRRGELPELLRGKLFELGSDKEREAPRVSFS